MNSLPPPPPGSKSKVRKGRKERPTFGFLLASLHTGASRALWPGLIDAASRLDVNLVCFPGGRLRGQEAFESQRNIIYDLAGGTCLDGIITWASSLGGVVGLAEINAFHNRYRGLPIVSLAQFLEGTPTVSIDSYHGMRALLEHLIVDHGYRRVAFIRGPAEHFYAQERYRAYLDTLQEHHLEIDQRLITRPLRWEAGAEAVNILLDELGLKPGEDFQAVAAVSDMLALWAMKTMQERGYQIPGDVAVTGFNNSIEERMSTPPLTTVDLPFYNQGAKAVEILLALWRGETVPALITLPSALVVRQSCGCPSAAVAQGAYIPDLSAGELSVEEAWGLLHAARGKCLDEIAAYLHVAAEERRTAWFVPLCDALLAEIKGSPGNIFISTLEDVLDQAMRVDSDVFLWHGVVSILRRWGLGGVPRAKKDRFEALFAQAHIAVSEAVQRSHAYWQWQAERQAENLRETARILLTTFDIPQLTNALTEWLPRLGIPSAYLALYDQPGDPGEQARLILAYTAERGRIPVGADGLLFPVKQLVPPDLLPARRYSLVVEPLFFQEKQIGFAVFEIGPQFRFLARIDAGHGDLSHFADLDGDRNLEFVGTDWTFAYWWTSFAESPAPEIILRFTAVKYRLAENLMRKPAPSEAELNREIEVIRNDESWKDMQRPPATLWGEMLDLIYSGNSAAAWRFFGKAWLAGVPGKDTALGDFKDQLAKSPYWPQIQHLNLGRK